MPQNRPKQVSNMFLLKKLITTFKTKRLAMKKKKKSILKTEIYPVYCNAYFSKIMTA